MKHSAEITISWRVDEYDPIVLMCDTLGQAFIEEEKKQNVWIESHETRDSAYPSFISVAWNEEVLGLGKFPEITLALLLKEKKDIDSIVSHCGLIEDLDPQDPFWCLAFEDGRWYFATTGKSLLEFEDGKPGVKKLETLNLDTLLVRGYVWDHKERKLKVYQQNGSGNIG